MRSRCGFSRMSYEENPRILSVDTYLKIFNMFRADLIVVSKIMPFKVFLTLTSGMYNGLSATFDLYLETQILSTFQAILEGKSAHKDQLLYLLITQLAYKVFDSFLVEYVEQAHDAVFQSVETTMQDKYLHKVCTLDVPTRDRDEVSELIAKADPAENALFSNLASSVQGIVRQVFAVPGAFLLLWSTLTSAQSSASWLPCLLLLFMTGRQLVLYPPMAFKALAKKTPWFRKHDFRSKHDRRPALEGHWISERANRHWYRIVRGDSWAEHWINGSTQVFEKAWQRLTKRKEDIFSEQYEPFSPREFFRDFADAAMYLLIAVHGSQRGKIKLDMAMINLIRVTIGVVLGNLSSIDSQLREIIGYCDCIESYCEFMEMKPDLEIPQTPVSYDGGKGMKIEFKNVTFTYPRKTELSLIDVCFTVFSGETAAFVGFNGAGKSTMAKLMVRLYDPQEGTILINDVDIRKYDTHDLHKHIGIVFQEFVKFDAESVGYNVGIACPPSMLCVPMLEEATMAAGIDTMVKTLKFGFDTLLDGQVRTEQHNNNRDKRYDHWNRDSDDDDQEEKETEDGTKINSENPLNKPDPRVIAGDENIYSEKVYSRLQKHRTALSGGQWQRLSLSRMFLRKLNGRSDKSATADLFILDEPTSALDAKAESALVEQMQGLSKSAEQSVTTVYISHRFTTIMASDRIICMKEGRVIENGTHKELMAIKDGTYRELYTAAAKPFQGK